MLAVLRICQVGDCEIEIIGTFPYPIRTKLQLEVAKFIVMVIVLSVANQAEQCGGLAIQKEELKSHLEDEKLMIYTSFKFENQSKLENFKRSIAERNF